MLAFAKIKLVFRNSIIYSLGNLSIALTGYLLIPVYTKHFDLAEYGVLGILEVTFQIISSIFGFAFYEAYNRWYFEKTSAGKQKSIFFTLIFCLTVILIVVNILLYLFADSLSAVLLDSGKYAYVFTLMTASASLQILGRMPLTLMKLQQRAGFYATSNMLRLVTNLSLTVYLIIGLQRGLNGIYEAQIIGHGIFFLLTAGYIRQNTEFRFESKILKEIWRYSYPLTFSTVIAIFLSVTDRYCLKFLATFEEIGIYSLGFKISSGIKLLIVQSVQLAISPIIYQMMDAPDNKRFYAKLMTYLGFGVMVFVLGSAVFSREIIRLVARQESYYAAHTFIPLLSAGVFFGMLRDTALTGINITRKTKIIPLVGITVSILNLAFNLMLIPLIGALGSAIATVVSNFLFFIAIYYFAQKIYHIPYELAKIGTIILTAAALFTVSEMISGLDIYWRLILKTGLLCAFPAVLYFLKFYDRAELRLLRNIFEK